MHEVLRALVERLGPEVFDDPDHFRGALDDVLDEGASLGDQNLVVDAVRLGAFASMMTMLRQGGDPSSSVAQAGAMLARDRGGDDQRSASWACAALAYAMGVVDEAEVRHYRTASRPPPPPPPLQQPPAPPTVPAYAPGPEPGPQRMGGRWLLPVLVVIALVAATTVGVLAADRLGGDDEPSTTPTASDTPTTTPPTTPTTTPPTTTPTTTPPTTAPTTGPTPVTSRVEYTCGNGDCFLSERAGPRVDAADLGTHNNGTTVRVVCQVVGQRVSSSVLGTSSRIWAQTADGGYVAAIFLSGIDKYAVTTPC